MKPTYRKSWAGNLLMLPDLTLDLSFKVKRGYPNLQVLITRLLLTCRNSWDGTLLMLLVLIFGSGVNGKLVNRISFHLGRNDKICKEYLSTSC